MEAEHAVTKKTKVLLFYMSLWNNRKNPQTNEAACLYLLRERQWKPDRIVALCSEAVRKNRGTDPAQFAGSTLEYYRDVFMPKAGFKDAKTALTVVETPDRMSDADRLDAIRQVADALPEEAELTIDLTGGLRDTAALLIAMVRYLKSFKRLTSCDVLYTEWSAGSSAQCKDVRILYDIFDLISATDLFLETGSARRIQQFFSRVKMNKTSQRLLQQVGEFSDSMSLCRFDKLEKDVAAINEKLDALRPNAGPPTLERLFFEFLAARFRQEFRIFENRRTSLGPIIRWCTERGMYQQALTLIAEDLPAYICRHTTLQPTKRLGNFIKEPYQNVAWSYNAFHGNLPYLIQMRSDTDERKSFSVEAAREFWSRELYNRDHGGAAYARTGQTTELFHFLPEEVDLLAEASACYSQVLVLRNTINHACNDNPDIQPSQVYETLEHTIEIVDRLARNPVPSRRPDHWLAPEEPLAHLAD